MASIFRRTDRNGKPADRYSIKYKDSNGKWRTVKGCPDLESTRKLAKKLESNATLEQNGIVVNPDKSLPLEAFRRHLEAKHGTETHIELTISQLRAIFKHCNFETIDSLRNPDAADIVNQFLKNKKRESKRMQLKADRKREREVNYSKPEKLAPISARTRNSYVISLKAFCKWCCVTKRMPDCALIHSLELSRQQDKPTRRAATDIEIDRILSAALNGDSVAGLSGEQRYHICVQLPLDFAPLNCDRFASRLQTEVANSAYHVIC